MPATGRAIYSIGAVSRMLGVPAPTLRSWQDRYGVVRPDRSAGGHRLFSSDQVEQLRLVVQHIREGASPADAHRLLQEHLRSGHDVPTDGEPVEERALVLLAERDPYAAELAALFLTNAGLLVSSAFDAEQAWDRFRESPVDIAIVDLLIGGGDGANLCGRIAATGRCPVLAVSTLDTPQAALSAGAAAFLHKPIEAAELVSAVKDLLSTPASIRPSPWGSAS